MLRFHRKIKETKERIYIMKLSVLLNGFEYECVQGNVDVSIGALVYDSRKVKKGDVFVALCGAAFDGHSFAAEVQLKGAAAIVAEKDITGALCGKEITVIKTHSTRRALAFMSAAYFGRPAERLITIGITGTKGKTTTAYMVKSVLERIGIRTGLIGTIETIIGDEHIKAVNTTPESYIVQETFAKMADAGLKCVVMEVSSQGLMLERVGGFVFDYGIFTNLSQDHIGPNEHKDFDEYLRCKAKLFKQCSRGIVNADDPYVSQIIEGASCEIETFGIDSQADLKAENLSLLSKPGVLGIRYALKGRGETDVEVDIPGRFSVYNSLTAIALCLHFTDDLQLICSALKEVQVKGRVEIVPVSDKYTVIVDYAHNAVSLESLLASLREYGPKRLIVLFGCGGERSRARRFEMGEAASRLADFTIVTSDNPRREKPEDIIADIITGIKRAGGEYTVIPDRRKAIFYALENALEGDVIVLAGKGHEDYQDAGGVKTHFSDAETVLEYKLLNT